MAFDPTGPGTTAWESADRAHLWWFIYKTSGGVDRRRAYKNYYNARRQMVAALRKHNTPPEQVTEWLDQLVSRRSEPLEYDERTN